MGVDDIEKILTKDSWMSAEEIAKKLNQELPSVRVCLNKLVDKWNSVERKKELINHNWRSFYKLK